MYKRMKKFLSFVISIFMILAYMPTKTHAFDVTLYIGGSQQTGSSGNGWTLTKSGNTATLTLSNANISADIIGVYKHEPKCGIYISAPSDVDVVIKLSGNNSVKSKDTVDSVGLELGGKSATIDCQGSGTLNITGYDYGIHAHCPLTIKNGSNGGEVRATSTGSLGNPKAIFNSAGNGITLQDGMGVYDPLGGYADGTTVYNSSGVAVKQNAVIKALPTYTAKFVNHDGSQLQSTQVTRGQTPAYTGATPTKPQDTEHTYSFNGWSPSLGPIGEDTTYTAQFKTNARKYTVKFCNYNGDLLESKEVGYGTDPTYTGQPPTKPANDQYTYTFSGWYPELAPVTGDATYVATYTSTTNQYTVTFINWDNTKLAEGTFDYGATPSYSGTTPTKPQDDQYTYTFIGWNPEITEETTVTGNITYRAVFREDLRKYTIRFINYDDTELQSEQVAYGETPTYTGQTPTKPAIEGHEYTFSGWSPEIKEVSGDAVYRATFTDTTLSYTIRFLNWDNSVLKNSQVPYGTLPTPPDDPTRPADAQYTYTFSGWNREIGPVTGATTYYAQYDQTVNSYTVRFINDDGTELDSRLWPYDATPVYSLPDPTKEPDGQYSYTFAGWDHEIVPVVGNTTYTATYNNTGQSYTIKFVNEDGTELQSSSVPYGETPAYNGTTPTKATDEQYIYTFAGWTPELASVTGDATYTATYNQTQLYTIKFVNEDGTELASIKVTEGETPVYSGTTPTKAKTKEYIYTFAGWSPEIVPATEDATYTAIYNTEANTEHSQTDVDPDNPEEITNDDEEPVDDTDDYVDDQENTPEEENLDTAESPAEEPETVETSDAPAAQESTESQETSDAPRTRDEAQFLLWLMLAAVSFGWLSFSAVASKKRILSLLNAIDNSGK